MTKRPYTKPGRLADVLALIQVLALDPDAQRSESGIARELQGPPTSSEHGWLALAKEHREFFRVNQLLSVSPERDYGLSLVARYVLPIEENGKRPSLPSDFIAELLQTAITLHDRQISAAEQWKAFIPLWTALVANVIGVLSALGSIYLKEHFFK